MPHIHIARKLLRPQRFLDCLLFVIFSLVQVVSVVPEPAAGGDVGGVGAEKGEHSVPGSLQTLHKRGLNDVKRARLSCGRIIRLHARPPPRSANKGPMRIQYKYLVPIYVIPEMKLCSCLISKTKLQSLSPNS